MSREKGRIHRKRRDVCATREDLIKEHPYKEGFFNMWEKDWHMRQFTS